MTRPPTRRDSRRPPMPSRSARTLLRHLPSSSTALTVQQLGAQAGLDDPRPGLRSLRRHGLAINRPDGWLLTPKGVRLLERLTAIPSPG